MPVYTYVCKACETHFEAFASIQKKESGWKPVCPHCGSGQTQQTFESVALLKSKQASATRDGGGCSCSLHRN